MPTTITLPQGNTLRQAIRVSYADGDGFTADDYAVIKVRNSIGGVLWSGVYNLGECADAWPEGGADDSDGAGGEGGGAVVIDWEISAEDSAKMPPGNYKWDMTAHIGAVLDARGNPVGAALVVTPEGIRLSDFIVERVASHGKRD